MDKHVFSFTQNLEFSAKLIGGSSFVIGTILFLAVLVNPIDQLFLVGSYFVLTALISNGILFLSLIICSQLFYRKRHRLLKTSALLLLNVPIAFIYILILVSHSF